MHIYMNKKLYAYLLAHYGRASVFDLNSSVKTSRMNMVVAATDSQMSS